MNLTPTQARPGLTRRSVLAALLAGSASARAEPVAAEVLAERPGAFLENLAWDRQGRLFVTDFPQGEILRYEPGRGLLPWVRLPGRIAGLAFDDDGALVVSGWSQGRDAALFFVMPDGQAAPPLPIAGGVFPNGVLQLRAGVFLVADSYRGAVWRFDRASGRSTPWLESELLARARSDDPTPGVNGLKRWRDELLLTNTARATLLRVPLRGDEAGTLQVLQADFGADDFAVDRAGRVYAATHVHNSVLRRDPDGRVVLLGGLAQHLAGSTAVAFGPGGERALYVTTNGGQSLPPPGGVQPGRLVRLDLQRGAP